MVLIYDHIKANQIAHPQLSKSDSKEEGSDIEFFVGEDSAGDSKSETEESLEDFEVELEVSEDFEKDDSPSPQKKKPKPSFQKRKKQKRQGNLELKMEDKEQSKDSDADQKVEEEIMGDDFNQSVGGDVEQIIDGEDPKTDQAKVGEKRPPSNPFVEGLKGFVDTLDWLRNSHKKAMEENKKLSHRIQILETISIGEGKSIAEYVEDFRKTIARVEEIRDAFNPRFEQVEKALEEIKNNDTVRD
ncbi:uncharacterized protein LOC131875115 [Cryptomeria japonica]|uniref:uncharacterized protein LOC131875115 n=1 Tax=Cryptomeria japonica TaxID=3369 RepID=UPI0027D9E6B2|nr:uncharacterized protein LOC131875115 [Cryptomeria japonica]